MAIRCEEVRGLLEAAGASAALSEERAGEVAEHLDQCGSCDEQLSRRIGEAVDALPVTRGPSLTEVRRLARRQVFTLRLAAAAAILLVLLATAWALSRNPAAPNVAKPVPPAADEPIPDPPRFEDLKESERLLIRGEGVLVLYLQFCLSCLNTPTEEDKKEFLIRAMLVFREARERMRAQFEKTPPAAFDAVTQEALVSALQTIRSSPLPSVKLLPNKINEFKQESPEKWHVRHLLGNTQFQLTLGSLPDYLSFAYLKKALGADGAQMARLEDVLWTGEFVNLPARLENKAPKVAADVVKALLPLLTPRQQKTYRKIAGVP
ncbi:MAG: zf-HC2 domain-containing protein [Planctomycetes bacterium]|nr:zf-HC2 domain-containing protein [Planctomycetota bacterium]